MKARRVVSVRASAMLAYIEKQSVLFLVLVARKYPDSDMWHINLFTTCGCLVQRLMANYVLAEEGIDKSPSVNSPSLCIRLTLYATMHTSATFILVLHLDTKNKIPEPLEKPLRIQRTYQLYIPWVFG